MTKKQLIIIICGVVLVILLVTGGILLFSKKGSSPSGDTVINTGGGDSRRENILKLAVSYAEAGEYARALNLIDGLLIENSNDEEARNLQMLILGMDRSDGTDALIEAQRNFLEEQRRQNAANAANQQRGGSDLSSAEADIAAARHGLFELI